MSPHVVNMEVRRLHSGKVPFVLNKYNQVRSFYPCISEFYA